MLFLLRNAEPRMLRRERRPYKMFKGLALSFHPILASSVVVFRNTQSEYPIPEVFFGLVDVVSMERSGKLWHGIPAWASSCALADSRAATRVNCFAIWEYVWLFECHDELMSTDGMLCEDACFATASNGSADFAEWWIVPSPLTITMSADDKLVYDEGSFLQSK